MAEIKAGTLIKNRYLLKEYKGSGSFGEVWLADDTVLGSEVAVKLYVSLDQRGVDEFRSEYITTQGISHPNLLTTTHFDVWEQHPFLVMKYCSNGASTAKVGQISETDLWKFIHDVSAGLHYLHSLPEPIIHQDIKPDNILVDDDNQFLITDFGISKKIRSTMRKQSQRAVGAGATAYMGPERFDADPSPVKASDIWSLGVSIYELATGELPFSGLGGGMQKNGAEVPSLGSEWSKNLNMVMQSCLAKDPWDRPRAEQLEDYSAAILRGENLCPQWISEPEPTPVPEPEETSNTKRLWLAIIGIAAAIWLLIAIWPSNSEEEPIIIPEEKTVSAPADKPSREEIPTVSTPAKTETPKEAKTAAQSAKEEPKQDNNAAILKNALANGDYAQIQQLANQGYAPAYAPLAKYYLRNNAYDYADTYAKKAKAAGISEGDAIIKALENLGYYD